MIVVDASAALAALLDEGPARAALGEQPVHVPHMIDAEIANGLRRIVARREIEAAAGWTALDTWRRLGVARYGIEGILGRIWQLRDNLSAYDASYVALAEALGCALVTGDGRLAGAPGIRCLVTVVPG